MLLKANKAKERDVAVGAENPSYKIFADVSVFNVYSVKTLITFFLFFWLPMQKVFKKNIAIVAVYRKKTAVSVLLY